MLYSVEKRNLLGFAGGVFKGCPLRRGGRRQGAAKAGAYGRALRRGAGAPSDFFYCKKLTKLVFMLRFGQLKVEKDSLLKTAFLHYPFFVVS